jgi:hypothetical protein
MMRRLLSKLSTLFLIFSVLSSNAQIRVDDDMLFEVDNLGYVYLGIGDQVLQLNQEGDTLNQYSNKSLGEFQAIDASNPHKILVHYENNSVVAFLDNKLGERSDVLYLQEKGLEQSALVCNSYNNGIWIYDKVWLGLFRLNANLEVNLKGDNLTQVLGGALQPIKMQEDGKWLYVADPEQGIFVFDIFGAYYKRIPLTGIQDFQIEAGKMYYLKAGKIYRRILNRPELEDEVMEAEGITHFRLRENKVFVVRGGKLVVVDQKF